MSTTTRVVQELSVKMGEVFTRLSRVESQVVELKEGVRVLGQGQGVSQNNGANPDWSSGNTGTTTGTGVTSTTTTPQVTFDPLSCILPQVANLTLSVCE